jgi:N4-(beta-N-acetylglucosaminyl)-L-asparaginase
MERRSFFRLGLTGLGLSLIHPSKLFSQEKSLVNTSNSLPMKPIIISTWSHGLAANEAAWEVLSKGGKALDAVEKGARVTEADVKNRSVGIGGLPDADGKVTLDACIMDENSRCGAVAYLEGIAHPISVARSIMENTPHVMLVGAGAKKYALKHAFETIKTPIPEVKKEYEKWKEEHEPKRRPIINHENHDTIGLIAMDEFGNFSGACTTSGWAYKLPGRVGDSPIIGAGLFVDNEVGAACATGLGEAIIRIAGSHTVVELMRQGFTPQKACEEAVQRILKKHPDTTNLQCCFLAINKNGEVGAHSVFNGFNYAKYSEGKNELIDATFDRKW